jgi:carbon monoxide dehydrogenase subunit G
LERQAHACALCDRIGGGTITLNDDATYQRTTTWQIARMDGTVQREFVRTEQGSYTGSVAGGSISLNLYGSVRMQIAISGNAMSAKYVVDQVSCGQPVCPPIVLGDVWRYER